jgi:cytidyltransferase-like protein
MLVTDDQLEALADKVAMVDGGFDPLHAGHIAYFRGAAELGCPVLCSVSPDTWVARKHLPLIPQAQRVQVIDAIRYIDYVYASPSSTEDVLRALRPRYYVKGIDWKGRLPAAEERICAEAGIEITFLDTVVDSSTAILRRFEEGHDRVHRAPDQ